MIELGLQRISRLLQHTPISWKAIHIAGTNGKGSIVSCISSLLSPRTNVDNDSTATTTTTTTTSTGYRCGTFTSPHLLDRWDCITINNAPISRRAFLAAESQIKHLNERHSIGATEFELLTATAFRIFEAEKVDVGVIEVGVGGRLDATNVLGKGDVLVTVISKIGLDHQGLLGGTVGEIAWEKGGVMKGGRGCVVDGSNGEEVMRVLERCAREVGAWLVPVSGEKEEGGVGGVGGGGLQSILDELELEPHQRINVSVAVTATKLAIEALHRERDSSTSPSSSSSSSSTAQTQTQTELLLSPANLTRAISTYLRPGRQQLIDLRPLVKRATPVLLDGAHNPQSAEVLSHYVETRIRRREAGDPAGGEGKGRGKPLTWILAMSAGKSISEILGTLVKPGSGDHVAAVEFGPVDGMPWVRACESGVLIEELQKGVMGAGDGVGERRGFGRDLKGALRWAEEKCEAMGTGGEDGSIVIAGSLYLVGEVLRERRRERGEEEEEEEEEGE